MSRYAVIDAKRHHCGQMARRMRNEQRHTMRLAGVDPHRQIVLLFNHSAISRAWLIDGQLAALGGVTGGLLSSHGFVWLIISDAVRRHPVAFIKEARTQLAEVMETMDEVATTIALNDRDALRMAAFLGFHVGHTGAGAPACNRQDRIALQAEVLGNAALRSPVRDAQLVAMGYHA